MAGGPATVRMPQFDKPRFIGFVLQPNCSTVICNISFGKKAYERGLGRQLLEVEEFLCLGLRARMFIQDVPGGMCQTSGECSVR